MTHHFDRKKSLLLMVDIQQKLLPVIDDHHAMLKRIIQLHQGACRLGVAVAVSEQYPKGLGESVEQLKDEFTNHHIRLTKTRFSAMDALMEDTRAHNYDQLVVCGIESHICVLQTVRDALALSSWQRVGFVADGMGSRTQESHRVAMAHMTRLGAFPLTVEMILFDWLKDAKDDAFKDVSQLIR